MALADPTVDSGASRLGPRLPSPAMFDEVQALRAVAVLAVVVYHIWPTRLPGGYVGVDVFFVISGFLITAHLLRELGRTSRVRFGEFYARRARRLLPAALVVLAATGVLTAVLLPERQWPQIFREIIGAAFYVENWVLALDSVDYLAQNANVASPVQHFWSLSVEEQFYLVWPLLLLGGWLLAARLSRGLTVRATWILAGLLGALILASFLAGVIGTVVDPGPTYFATHTRAWEFLAGGLLALLDWRGRAPEPLRAALSWAGLVAIVGSSVLYDATTPFPGVAAAVPVLGALAVIAAGTPDVSWSPSRLMRLGPVQWIGDVSYSLYLWHWPVIVFAPFVIGADLSFVERVGLLVLSILLAAATKAWVEDPVRLRSPLVSRRPRFSLVVFALAVVPLVVGSVAASASATASIAAQQERVEQILEGDTTCLGAGVFLGDCNGVGEGSGALIPAPDAAASDDVNTAECWSRNGDDELRVCTHGPADSETVLALVGDSHSNQYLATMMSVAEERGWRVDVFGKTGCIWTAAEQENDPTWVANCESWKAKLQDRLLTGEPYDLIVTSASAESAIRPDGASAATTAADGFVDAWTPVADRGTRILAIRDNPHARDDYLACIERDPGDAADRCAEDRDSAFRYIDAQIDAVPRVSGAALLDLSDYFCDGDRCPPVIGDVIVYRDPGHITSTYARTLAPVVASAIAENLAAP